MKCSVDAHSMHKTLTEFLLTGCNRIGTYEYQNAPKDYTRGDFVKQVRFLSHGSSYVP